MRAARWLDRTVERVVDVQDAVSDPRDEPEHQAPFECETCGWPEWSATSMMGCYNCGSQDDIVPRGTVNRRRRLAREGAT